jgi:hypothetical protein
LDENEDMLTASYALKYDSTTNRIDDLKLSNVRLQIVMKHEWYKPIMDIVFEGHDNSAFRIQQQVTINHNYNSMMGLLRNIQTFTDEQLQNLQQSIDVYCDSYLAMHGNRDVTNYLHTLQAGHVRHQIRRFGSLFRYANIGFEAYIGTIRRYLQHRTQNGGHGGKGSGLKVGNAHQACRLAKRVSVHMVSQVAKKDNPSYYKDLQDMGKRHRKEVREEDRHAAIPIVDD